jgi:P pilus assembly chaperone PapD
MHHTLYQYFLLIGLLFCLPYKHAAQSISASPTRIFFKSQPNTIKSETIIILNESSEQLILKSSFKDWTRDSIGHKVYFEPNTLPHSNAAWLKVEPEIIEIAPKSQGEVTVTLTAPGDSLSINRVRNAMLFLSQINEQKPLIKSHAESQIGISIRVNLGIHVYSTPAHFRKKELQIENILDKGVRDSARIIAIQIKNTGELMTDNTIRLELTNKTTGEEINLAPLNVSLMPDLVNNRS